MDYVKKIESNIKKLESKNIKIIGVAKEGIALQIIIPKEIDIFDFMEEFGQYFYKIDNKFFGQKYVSQETKEYVYHWLMEIFNSGNYEELTDKTIFNFNMEIDFNKVGTFKFAIQKYDSKLYSDRQNRADDYVLFACNMAIQVLRMIDTITEMGDKE